MNQKPPLRNEVELSPKRFLAESSTKGLSAQDLRPKFQPIYQFGLFLCHAACSLESHDFQKMVRMPSRLASQEFGLSSNLDR